MIQVINLFIVGLIDTAHKQFGDGKYWKSWLTQILFKITKHYSLNSSVTRLGDFLNFLATNFITKEAQMFSDLLGKNENHRF